MHRRSNSKTLWSTPDRALRTVLALQKTYHNPSRNGPVDVFLRFYDAVRADYARRIIRSGLHLHATDRALAEALVRCDAVQIGFASHNPTLQQHAADLACRFPTPRNTAALARAIRDARDAYPSHAAILALARESLDDPNARRTLSLLARQASAAKPDQLIAILGGLGQSDITIRALRELSLRSLDDTRRALRDAPGTPGVFAAIRLIRTRALANAAAARLREATSDDVALPLLRLAHLALIPSRARAMAQVPALADRWTSPSSPRWQRLGSVRLARARIGEPMARRRQCTSALTDPDPVVRRTLLDAAPPAVLADLCFDSEECIARGAAWRRSEVGLPVANVAIGATDATRTLLGLAERSPHAAVRRAATADRARLGGLSSPVAPDGPRALALRQRIREDAPRAIDELRAVLLGEAPGDAVGAMRLSRRAGVHTLVEDELIELVRRHAARTDAEACRCTATAIATLAGVGTHRARAAIAIGLRHPDARVRANAVEATETGRSALDERLVELKRDPHHRVRANVLRAMASAEGDFERAASGMASMLGERSRLPKLAGLWAVERTAIEPKVLAGSLWVDVARRVAGLARSDDDNHVRARAVRTARRLMTSLDAPSAAA